MAVDQTRRPAELDGPTAELRTEIYAECPIGRKHAWRPAEDVPTVSGYVYSEGELRRMFDVRGPQVAELLRDSPAPAFRITGHCLTTGATVGQWPWRRSAETRRWIPDPDGEQWVVWDDSLRLEAEARKEAEEAAAAAARHAA